MRFQTQWRAVLAILASCGIASASFGASVPLHMVPGSNATFLMAEPLSEPGALFVFQAPDLASLSQSPTIFLQTNTPCSLCLPTGSPAGTPGASFFFAIHWAGRSVSEFGSPEYAPSPPPPGLILITSGLPDSLTPGSLFTVDFFVTDPIGQLLDLSAPVEIVVVQQADGAIHPNAQVIPAAQQLTLGHLRAQISVQSTTSLAGYTLGTGPVTYGGTTTPLLLPTLNLGPNALPSPTADALLQILQTSRSAGHDSDASWSSPLPPSVDWEVAGTYGEWRGKFNQDVHTGLDLATVTTAQVVASRGGVVSCVATLPGLAGTVVIDHGDGWFSRYAGLDSSSIRVIPGQGVLRGATLASGLSVTSGGPVHLHFEIRHGDGMAHWGVMMPGSSQDPLQTAGVFSVPRAASQPQLEELGLTQTHPGQQASASAPPLAGAPGGQVSSLRPAGGSRTKRSGRRIPPWSTFHLLSSRGHEPAAHYPAS